MDRIGGKIGFYNTEVFGWRKAIDGMRAPMQSYHLTDSVTNLSRLVELGESDLKLMRRLIKTGSEHAKFLRMIHIQVEVAMPRYIWSEMDTYKISTVANSESTMHRLLNNNNPITKEQFYLGVDEKVANETWINIKGDVEKLEEYRQQYKGLKPTSYTKNQLLTIAKRILPECFIQIRFWDLNYQTAYNMYNQRVVCSHRLKEEWVDCFGTWCKRLPKFKELFLDETISEVV